MATVNRLSFVLLAILFVAQSTCAQRIDAYNRIVQKEREHDFDAMHYTIRISLDDANKSFRGATTVSLLPMNEGFSQCILHAGMYTVTNVESESGQSLHFTQNPEMLVVDFLQSYGPKDTVRFTVSYQSNSPVDSTGQTHGMNYMPATSRRPAQIFTRSFPRGARNWFPCYDEPNDKATMDIIATVRSDYELLSNGSLVGVQSNPDEHTRTFHWSQTKPHSTYLSVIMAAPYVIVRDSLGSLPINYWVYPNDAQYVQSTFSRTPEIIDFFNKEYGFDYPWAKYDQATIAGIGGGAECTSASELGENVMHDERAEEDFSAYGWLICHEAAHQWWGDLITCRDWTHTWLNESFGTYSEIMMALHDKGADDAAINVLGKKNDYFREAYTRYMRPIVFDRWDQPNDNFDRHTYQKGAVLIHHLRWILGEKNFHSVLAHFLKTNAYKPVGTEDFIRAIKESTGKDLQWFFDDWFYRPGHPIFSIHSQWNEQEQSVTVTIDQTQDTTNGIPVFRTPVVIKIVGKDGSQRHTVNLGRRHESFTFPAKERPLMVRFDEGNHLLKEWTFEKTGEEVLFQLQNDDVIGRLWAMDQLVRLNDPRTIGALKQAASEADFWAVRRGAIYRLAGFRGVIEMDLDRGLIQPSRLDSVQELPGINRADMSAFFRRMMFDNDSRVRAAAAYGLGNLQSREETVFLMEHFRKEKSYLVQGAILRALGKSGDRTAEQLLREASQADSPRNILRSSAQWSLARLAK